MHNCSHSLIAKGFSRNFTYCSFNYVNEIQKQPLFVISKVRVKKKFIEEGFEASLERSPTTRIYESKSDGDMEAKLVTLCFSEPPQGYAKWSLRLLADKMVEMKYVESISHVTVRSVLKKTNLNPGK